MNAFIVALIALASLSASAQQVYPNQMCKGVNENDKTIETSLYLGKKIDKTYSSAKLIIELDGKVIEVEGTITNKTDLSGARMFKNTTDTLRYLTTGLIMDVDSFDLRANMECTKFRTIFL